MPVLSGFLLFTVALPLVGALSLAVPSLRHRVAGAAPWLALPALALALVADASIVVEVPWLLLGSQLAVDDTARVFLLFTSVVWLVAGQHARRLAASDPAQYRFFACFLVTMAGNLGVILAADMVTFYFFFAVMSFASYGLVIHTGDAGALAAGRVYMAFVVAGETLLFVGIAGIAGGSGSITFAAVRDALADGSRAVWVAFVLAGFAVKTAAVPLHMWLPLAYRASPVPGAAVLSGPMIKAGLLGWLRFLPLGAATLGTLGLVCMVAGFVSAFWGVCVGLTQKDARTALGYSSISQMGLIATGIGVCLMVPATWPLILPALTVYALHHATAKSALFLGAGMAAHGRARTTAPHRVVMAGLVFLALALAGAPFTSGAVAKVALKKGLEAGPISSSLIEWLLSAAAVGTTLLMARFLALVRTDTSLPDHPVRPTVVLNWLALAAAPTILVWLLPWADVRSVALAALAPAYVWSAFWPPALGLAIAWSVWRWPQALGPASSVHVPPGDVLVPVTMVAHGLRRSTDRAAHGLARAVSSARQAGHAAVSRSLRREVGWVEGRLQAWEVVGLLLLVLTVLVALLSSPVGR